MRGSTANTSTPSGSRPVSSWASRSAVATASSPSSEEPPGKDTCPGWDRMVWARSVSSRSGPSGPSPKSTSTAPSRGAGSAGGRNALRSSPVIVRTASRTGSSHSGRGTSSFVTDGGLAGTGASLPSASDSDPELVGHQAHEVVVAVDLGVDEPRGAVLLHPQDPRKAPDAVAVRQGPARVGQLREPRARGAQQLDARLRPGVLVVDAEHGQPVPGLLREPGEVGQLALA